MSERRLAAIMFTDIVGYTALMGKDEDRAFQVLDQNVNLQRTLIEKYKGKFLKQIGDGIVASFSSTYNAVICAKEILNTTREKGNYTIRIGIHEGDIVFKGKDVYGDGVNIASRLQEEADDGCICISEVIYKNIKNKTDINAEFLKEKILKNVDHPIKIYALEEGNLDIKTSRVTISEESKPPLKSIIVLPFENISPDPDQEYFSDGLTEEIITDLSHIHDLLVISRNSAMTFKGTKKKTREIANEVNVRYVLEGSVRKAGNNLRIVAQLIDAQTDTHLWAEKYSGTLDDIFDIQEKVSRSIAESLKIQLSDTEKKNLSIKKIDNLTAYEQYLLARYEIWQATKESLGHAIQILNNSTENIGRNEYLLVALAYAYFQYVNLGIDPNIKFLDMSEELVDEALTTNPALSKAHFLKSAIHETRGERKEAFSSIKQALHLDPSDPDSLMMTAFLCGIVGKPEIGKPYAKKAIEVDPLSPIQYCGEWWVNSSTGNFDRMLEACRKMYNLDKENLLMVWSYANALAYNGKIKEATNLFDSMLIKNPDQFHSMLGKAQRHALNNEKQESLESINDQLKKAAEMDHLWAWILADVYSLIGEKDKAIDYVERATRDIFIDYPFFNTHDPFLENIRGEPRFKKLMARIKTEWENFEV